MELRTLLRKLESIDEVKDEYVLNDDSSKGEISPWAMSGGMVYDVFKIKSRKREQWEFMKVATGRISYKRLCGYKSEKDGKQIWGEVQIADKLENIDGFVEKLDGPYIIEEDQLAFITQELGDMNLESYIGENKLSEDRILSIITDLAEALGKAHDVGVFHRDIKPENVIMFGDKPKWCDFSEAGVGGRKSTLVERGTRLYLAPEVLEDSGKSKTKTAEIYGMGEMLYHMVVGESPYTEKDIENCTNLVKVNDRLAELKKDHQDLGSRMNKLESTSVSESMKNTIRKSMDPDPSKRHQTLNEFKQALDTEYSGRIKETDDFYRTAIQYLKGINDNSETPKEVAKDEFGVLMKPETLEEAVEKVEGFRSSAGELVEYSSKKGLDYSGINGKAKDVWNNLKPVLDSQEEGIRKIFIHPADTKGEGEQEKAAKKHIGELVNKKTLTDERIDEIQSSGRYKKISRLTHDARKEYSSLPNLGN
ncbi:MAG: protein kinase [Candidatus Woesearchaeota archaeon]